MDRLVAVVDWLLDGEHPRVSGGRAGACGKDDKLLYEGEVGNQRSEGREEGLEEQV